MIRNRVTETVTLNADAIDSLARLVWWRSQLATSNEKEARKRLEEQRSYAAEVCTEILRANPELAARLREEV